MKAPTGQIDADVLDNGEVVVVFSNICTKEKGGVGSW
jgi:hypothetical protein